MLTLVLALTGQLRRHWWVAGAAIAVGIWTLTLMALGVVAGHLLAQRWMSS